MNSDAVPGENFTPLSMFDKDEWKSVCQTAQKNLSDLEFELAWNEFVKLKRYKQLN